jgi:flagellin
MSIVNTNVPALAIQNVLRKNSQDMDNIMEKLSTGKRINSGADDPGGLMVATRLKSHSLMNRIGEENANTAISMLQLFSSNGQVVIDILAEMKQIAVRAASDTYNLNDRMALDSRFNILGQEWARLASDGQWNGGVARMNTFTNSFTVRLDSAPTVMTMTFKSWDPTNRIANQNVAGATAIMANDDNARADWAWGFDRVFNNLRTPPVANSKSHSHVQSITAATNAVTKLGSTMDNASAELALYGAYINRLDFAANYAITAATETDRAYSKIVDVDYAKTTTELSRSQIISQAATAILAQANQLPQTVLKLLQ